MVIFEAEAESFHSLVHDEPPSLEIDVVGFKNHFSFDLTDISITSRILSGNTLEITATRLDADKGWSEDMNILVAGTGFQQTVHMGSSETREKKTVVELLLAPVPLPTLLVEPSVPYDLPPCPSAQWVTRDVFNARFHADLVVLPTSLYAVGFVGEELWLYNEKYWEKYFMVEACVQHLVRVARSMGVSKMYFVICGYDGLGEGLWPTPSRTRPRIFGERECVDWVVAPLEDDEYPVFHREEWVLAQSTLRGMPNAVGIVDRHYFYHNLYNPFRSWHRGIPFLEKKAKIVFGGQERGSRHNFLHRRDIAMNPRAYFWSDAVPKTHVEPTTRQWMDRRDQVNYRYILDVDGNASTWDATAWKMNSGSVIFKVESGWRQWFYDDYLPWVHYVPIADDFRDLDEKFAWCEAHPEECLAMIRECKALFHKVYTFSRVVESTRKIVQMITRSTWAVKAQDG